MNQTLNINNSVLTEIKETVETRNQKKLNTLLDCQLVVRKKWSLDFPLLSSTDRCLDLLDILKSHLSDHSRGPVNQDVLSLDQVLRALLMVSPCYETPWRAMVEFASAYSNCISVDVSSLYICVASMEGFLIELESSPNTATEQNTGSLFWLERLTNTIMSALLSETFSDRFAVKEERDSFCQIFSDLIGTILSKTRALDLECFKAIAEVIFHRAPPPTRILQWLELTFDSLSFIGVAESDSVGKILLEKLGHIETDIPVQHFRRIIDISMNLANAMLRKNDPRSFSIWWQVTMHTLHAGSSDPEIYCNLEDCMCEFFKILKFTDLESWVVALSQADNEQNVPAWISLNALLVAFQSIRQSETQLVSTLVKRALLKMSTSNSSILATCCRSILRAVFSIDIGMTFQNVDLIGDIKGIVQAVDGISYTDRGSFVDRNGNDLTIFSKAGQILLKTVFLGRESHGDESLTGAAKRITRLVEVGNFMLRTLTDDDLSVQTMLFSVIVLTVAFIEMPSCHDSLVRKMAANLSSTGMSSNSCVAQCAAISLIFYSLSGKNEQRNKIFGKLDPICDLLLNPLPRDVFCHLSLTLSPLERARVAILSSSKRSLERMYIDGWQHGDTIQRQKDETSPQSAIFGFLELLRKSAWGDCEYQAWKYFSDSIVLNLPPLLIADRTWLYEQIEDLIKNEELSLTACFHFLRAAIVRASSLLHSDTSGAATYFEMKKAFIVWEDSHIPLARQVEDVVVLHRLIVSLLCYIAEKTDESEANSILFAQGREALLGSILAFREKSDPSDLRPVVKYINNCLNESKEEFSVNCGAVVCLLSHILASLMMRGSLEPRNQSNAINRSHELLGTAEVFTRLLFQETEAVKTCSPGDRPESYIPSWLAASHAFSGQMESRQVKVEESKLLPDYLHLFDFMIEVLFAPKMPIPRLKHNQKSLYQQIVLAVGRLLFSKDSIASTNRQLLEGEGSTLNAETVNRTAIEFFKASSVVVQDIISRNCSLAEAEEFITPILQYCDALKHIAGNIQMPEGSRLLESCWTLYQIIGSEQAAIRFIGYLEAHFSEANSAQENDLSICSLRSIRSAEDVDLSIQKIRLQVLCALKTCFSFTSTCLPDQLTETIDPFNAENTFTTEPTGIRTEFIVSALEALSNDLRSGLDGNSGGITSDLFLTYVESIEECAMLLYENSTSTNIKIPLSMLRVVMEVAETFSDIIITFPLDDAVLFRSSFIMASTVLPSIYREILRKSSINFDSPLPDLERVSNIDQILVSDTCKDCLAILRRWSSLRDPNSVPWEDIARLSPLEREEEETALPTEDQSLTTTKNSYIQNKIPRIVHVHTQDSQAKVIGNRKKIRLRTKETWSWALSCTLLSFEEKWRGSFRVILESKPSASDHIDVGFLSRHFETFRDRRNELLSCLLNVGKFFRSSSSIDDQLGVSGQQVILEMLAMNLPSAPMLRLCGTLGVMSAVLCQSIELLCWYIQYGHNVVPVGRVKLDLLECVCCVSAWFSVSGSDIDFPKGLFRWLSILRRKRPPGEPTKKKINTASVIEKLEKVDISVRSLTEKLQELIRLMQEATDECEAWLGPIVDMFFDGGLNEIHRTAEVKLKLLRAIMPRDEQLGRLPDFPVSDDSGKKKRARVDSKIRPKKRRAVRSRNRVVEMFMRMDEEIGNKEGTGGDVFVDLEDFLIEG